MMILLLGCLCPCNKKARNLSVTGLCFKKPLFLQFLKPRIANPVSVHQFYRVLPCYQVMNI